MLIFTVYIVSTSLSTRDPQVSLLFLRATDVDNVVINYVRCAGTRDRHLRLAISVPHGTT